MNNNSKIKNSWECFRCPENSKGVARYLSSRAKNLIVHAALVLTLVLGLSGLAQAANVLYGSGHGLDTGRMSTFGGHSLVGTFSGNDSGWANALGGGLGAFDAIIVGESAVINSTSLSATTRSNIAAYVSGGGRIIVLGAHGFASRETFFFNNVFAYSTTQQGTTCCGGSVAGTLQAGAAGTTFAGGPATLGNLNLTVWLGNTPGTTMYSTSGKTLVFMDNFGAGVVGFLGWDFCCGGSSSERDDWYRALDSALGFVGGFELWGSSSLGTNSSSVFRVDEITGQATLVGSSGLGEKMPGLDFDPTTGVLYGIQGGGSVGPARLVTIDPGTGLATIVGVVSGPGFNGAFGGSGALAFSQDGTLYVSGWSGGATFGGKIMNVDKTTGAVLSVAQTGIFAAGMDFDSAGVLWISRGGNGPGTINTVDPNTGSILSTLSLSGSFRITDITFAPDGTLYGADRPNNRLVTVDTVTGLVTGVGTFGVDVSQMAGLTNRGGGTAPSDTTPPTITAPADKTVEATALSTPVALGTPTVSDDVSAVGDILVTNTAPSGFPLGTTVVTWTATDEAGNSASDTQNITVVDTTPPVVSAPPNMIVEATGPLTNILIGTATAIDLADPFPVITSNAPTTGDFPLGVTTVTWTATDASGNVGTAIQTITVQDTTPPTITAPADISVEATAPLTPVAIGTATASDTADPSPVVTNNAPASGEYPVGTTVVTWTATDASGNSTSATQNVTVTDTTPPVITVTDRTEEATGPSTPVDVSADGSATDAVGVVSLTNNSPGTFPVGTTTVTWTATDAAGNSASATQNVTIVDTTPPVISNACLTDRLWPPNHEMVLVGTGSVSDIADPSPLVDISVTSNQPINGTGDGNTDPDWIASTSGGDYDVSLRAERAGNLGQRDYGITVTATDASGNVATATCSASVPHDKGKK
jgi:HYR domain-containing protein